MKFIKNLLLVFLAVFVAVAATGCGSNKDSGSDKESSAKVSDNLFDFQVSLDGEVYALPLSYSELKEDGWKTKEDLTRMLEPNQYSIGMVFTKGDKEISLELVNTSDAVKPMEDCQVGGIDTSPAKAKKLPDLTLAKGIEIGATKEEITKAYGEPSQKTDDPNAFTYIDENYQMAQFTFSKDDNKLENILIRNLGIVE